MFWVVWYRFWPKTDRFAEKENNFQIRAKSFCLREEVFTSRNKPASVYSENVGGDSLLVRRGGFLFTQPSKPTSKVGKAVALGGGVEITAQKRLSVLQRLVHASHFNDNGTEFLSKRTILLSFLQLKRVGQK